MVPGKKKTKFNLNKRITSSSPSKENGQFRGLSRDDLGGVIFGCTNETIGECFSKQLFGLPFSHFSYVENIGPSLPLFLFNYDDRMLHGIFEAVSNGKMNIDPYGWTKDGSEKTAYPAQVQVHLRIMCKQLPERRFRNVISGNFYENRKFWFELDHAQVTDLILLFMSGAGNSGNSSQDSNWGSYLLPKAKKQPIGKFSGYNDETSDFVISSMTEVPSEIAQWNEHETNDLLSNFSKLSCGGQDVSFHKTISRENSDNFDLEYTDSSSSFSSSLDGRREPLLIHSDKKIMKNKKSAEPARLKDSTIQCGHPKVLYENQTWHYSFSSERNCAKQANTQRPESPNSTKTPEKSSISPVVDLLLDSDTKLLQDMENLKKVVMEQQQHIKELEKRQVENEREIKQLKDCTKQMQRKMNFFTSCSDDKFHPPVYDLSLKRDEQIYVIGGNDGNTWLSSFDSYFPSMDLTKPLMPMSCPRAYGAATRLHDDIYVFGGGNGEDWFDTVECYTPSKNKWFACPSLNCKRGSLGGVTVHNKIFAIGGGNGYMSFSDVEMLDPILGRWIHMQPMLQKRFALAVTEFMGVIYAVGGFDGKCYLRSVESYDHREPLWRKLGDLNTRRGCHSVTVLNGKIYALGGNDGDQMLQSVEVYDLRANSWMMCEPMNDVRGYASAGVTGQSLYVIGGLKDSINFVNSVEYYTEGMGWNTVNSSSLGTRFYHSAVFP